MKLLGGNPHVLSLENWTNKMALQFVFIQKRPHVISLYIHRRRLNYLCVAVWDFVWSVACMADWSFHVCYTGMSNPCIFYITFIGLNLLIMHMYGFKHATYFVTFVLLIWMHGCVYLYKYILLKCTRVWMKILEYDNVCFAFN